MSFAERHKAWLLPLLGAGVLGVVYMNMKMLGTPAAPAAVPTPVSVPPTASPMTPTTTPATTPPSTPQADLAPSAPPLPPPRTPAGASAPGQDLWADLRALEVPGIALHQGAELLRHGERPLDAAASGRRAVLHPGAWGQVGLVKPPTRIAAAREAELPPPPPPAVTFVGRTPSGPVAWIDQRPYREGDVLPGGYRVVRIALDRVRFEWGGKVLERPVLSMSDPPKEAP